MNWYSQLTQLILSFYREDPIELQRLSVLRNCKVTRRWGALRIDCRDRATAKTIVEVGHLLQEPIAQMRLAQDIKVMVRGELIETLPVPSPKLTA
jgi:hypothetical protein